jgi:ribosomal protein L19
MEVSLWNALERREKETRTNLHLQPERHVKVLRDHVLRPDLGEAIVGIDEAGILDSGPSEERVVADEGSDLAIGAAERDSLVDSTGEVGDTVLEVVTLSDKTKQRKEPYNIGSCLRNRRNEPMTIMTSDSCWMIAISGEASSSEAASRKQSSGTRVSESIIRMYSPLKE